MMPFSTPTAQTPGGGPKRNRNNERTFARKAVKTVHDRIDAVEQRVDVEKARHDHTESFLAQKFPEYEPYSVRRAREELANATSQACLAQQPTYHFPVGSNASGDQIQNSSSTTSLGTMMQMPDYNALARELKEMKDMMILSQNGARPSKDQAGDED